MIRNNYCPISTLFCVASFFFRSNKLINRCPIWRPESFRWTETKRLKLQSKAKLQTNSKKSRTLKHSFDSTSLPTTFLEQHEHSFFFRVRYIRNRICMTSYRSQMKTIITINTVCVASTRVLLTLWSLCLLKWKAKVL